MVAGAGQEQQGLVIPVLEHLPFQIDQHVEKLKYIAAALFLAPRDRLHMKQNRPLVAVNNGLRLLWCGRVGRAAVALSITAAAELAF